MQMRRDVEHNPHKNLSNTLGGVQAYASQRPEPYRIHSFFILQVKCCVALHLFDGAGHKTTSHPHPYFLLSAFLFFLTNKVHFPCF